MEFGFTHEQSSMGDAIGRLLQDLMPFDAVRAGADRAQWDEKLGAALAEAGVARLCASQAVGGLALGAVDAVAVVVECGRHLAPWPVSETLLAHALIDEAQAAYLKDADPGADEDCAMTVSLAPGLSFAAGPAGRTVSGVLPVVSWAAGVRWLIAAVGQDAAISVAPQAPELVLVDLHHASVRVDAVQSLDLTSPSASVGLQAYPLLDGALLVRPVREARNLAALLAATEALGAAERCLQLTNEYLKERVQFKRPIGTFQALKHMMADDAVRVESMRVALLYAAWAIDAKSEDADMAVAVAKSYVSDAARRVAENAIQLHGGIAYTWEFGLHLYLRRILRCAAQAGTAREHREMLAAALLDQPVGFHPAAAFQI